MEGAVVVSEGGIILDCALLRPEPPSGNGGALLRPLPDTAGEAVVEVEAKRRSSRRSTASDEDGDEEEGAARRGGHRRKEGGREREKKWSIGRGN